MTSLCVFLLNVTEASTMATKSFSSLSQIDVNIYIYWSLALILLKVRSLECVHMISEICFRQQRNKCNVSHVVVLVNSLKSVRGPLWACQKPQV